MMDPLATKVAERYANQRIAERIVNKEEIRKRIEAIPGWNRSNFLQSLYRQVERFPLSDKQLAVLDKIEKEQVAHAPKGPHADVTVKKWLDSGITTAIIGHFRKKPVVTVLDLPGAVRNNTKLHEYIVHQLDIDFYGQAEMYAEYNADEDDPKRREQNSIMEGKWARAGEEMEHAKIHVKVDGPLVTLTLTPSYQDIMHRNGLH